MKDCLFCKIAAGEIDTDFIAQSDHAVVFEDINPKAPVHLLVVPQRHIESLEAASEADQELLGELMLLAQRAARVTGVAQSGYKVAMNVGRGAGQLVDHLHLHVLGGWDEKPEALDI